MTKAPSYITGVLGATHVEIEHHLEMGRKLLAAGQLAEALSHYHSAVGKVTGTHRHTLTHIYALIAGGHFLCFNSPLQDRGYEFNKFSCTYCVTEGDSKNYLTYYKRAAVFLAMGKSKSALPDLTRAIQLKPDFLAVSLANHNQKNKSLKVYIILVYEMIVCHLYVPALSGPVAKREYPVKAGKHRGGS